MQTPTKRVCGAASEHALLGKLAYKAPYVKSLLKGDPDVGGPRGDNLGAEDMPPPTENAFWGLHGGGSGA